VFSQALTEPSDMSTLKMMSRKHSAMRRDILNMPEHAAVMDVRREPNALFVTPSGRPAVVFAPHAQHVSVWRRYSVTSGSIGGISVC
jgi:hypothetical protein